MSNQNYHTGEFTLLPDKQTSNKLKTIHQNTHTLMQYVEDLLSFDSWKLKSSGSGTVKDTALAAHTPHQKIIIL